MKPVLRIIFLLLVIIPLAAWFIVKPIRAIAPSTLGMHCASPSICVDEPDKLQDATALYNEALLFVGKNVGAIEGTPLVVFCSTQHCADQFGLGARSAVTVGTVGTVIGPKAWKNYYVRHELIHQLQWQRFGVLQLLFKPSWLIEGMAYSLSDDPRAQLAEPLQQYRNQFKQWIAQVGRDNMWQAAKSL